MSSSYREPSWACPPPKEGTSSSWTLMEIKGGVEVAVHELDLPCTILGRDMVNITTAHESCSRQHARIAFDKQGVPWLRDLASTHGTTVNKRKLPSKAIGKTESNSVTEAGARGVVLFPGDVLQFGESTRVYCLEGPQEYERGAVRPKPTTPSVAPPQSTNASPLLSTDSAEKKPATEKTQDEGVSWGMDMEDPSEQVGDDDSSSLQPLKPLDPSEIPERHRKSFERLMAKQYKLSNLQLESERIRRKGMAEELTAGQTNQLQRNEERIANLTREVEEAERELRHKLNPTTAQKPQTSKRSVANEDAYDDDVDDFYDRTVDHTRRQGEGQEETEQSLTAKWKRLHTLLQQRTIDAARSQDQCAKLQHKLYEMKKAGDEDAFFVQNDIDLAKDVAEKAKAEKLSVINDLTETERLLRIVNDKLVFDRNSCYIGEKSAMPPPPPPPTMPPPPPTRTMLLPPTSSNGPPQSTEEKAVFPPTSLQTDDNIRSMSSMPPPLSKAAPGVEDAPQGNFMPPPKRQRILGPAGPAPTCEKANEPVDNMPPPGIKMKKTPVHPKGTLSSIASSGRTEVHQKSNEFKDNNKAAPKKVDPKKDEWRMPAGQDGSGITKLNAKFAGRY